MKTKFITASIVLLMLCVSSSTITAQQVAVPRGGPVGSWRLLGTVTANHTADHDAIIVAGPYDFFRRLKFKVTNAPLNGESREIDLKGGRRKIKSVEFWYDTKGFLNGRANVTLFGIK